MPAAAVIPAPIAYINVVAVKKLVVGYLAFRTWPALRGCCAECRGSFFRFVTPSGVHGPDHLL